MHHEDPCRRCGDFHDPRHTPCYSYDAQHSHVNTLVDRQSRKRERLRSTLVDHVYDGPRCGTGRWLPGQRLAPQEKQVLRLQAEGVSLEEIAATVGRRASTVRQWIRSATEKRHARLVIDGHDADYGCCG